MNKVIKQYQNVARAIEIRLELLNATYQEYYPAQPLTTTKAAARLPAKAILYVPITTPIACCPAIPNTKP